MENKKRFTIGCDEYNNHFVSFVYRTRVYEGYDKNGDVFDITEEVRRVYRKNIKKINIENCDDDHTKFNLVITLRQPTFDIPVPQLAIEDLLEFLNFIKIHSTDWEERRAADIAAITMN